MNEYEIRAFYDDKSIIVYQAYQKAIAIPADTISDNIKLIANGSISF